jgi:hypothetical protein
MTSTLNQIDTPELDGPLQQVMGEGQERCHLDEINEPGLV